MATAATVRQDVKPKKITKMTNNLPLSEVYKQMTLPQLQQILYLKKLRPRTADNMERIREVEVAIKFIKAQMD